MVEPTGLTRAFFEDYPDEVTAALEAMAPADAAAVIAALPPQVCAPAFEGLTPAHGAALLDALAPDARAAIVDCASAPMAARFVRRLPEASRARLLDDLPGATALRRALDYTEGTVGALTNVAVPTVTIGATVADARATARRMARDAGNQLFVVDRAGRLAGRIDMAELLRRPDETRVESVMVRSVAVLSDRAVLGQVADSPGWDHTRFLPVADRGGRFVGVLAHADFRATLGRQRTAGRDGALAAAPLELCALYVAGMVRLLELASDGAADATAPGAAT